MPYTSKTAILVAGGKGLRMGTAVSKQFLPLSGKPVLFHTISAFISAYPDISLVLVLPEDQLSYAQMVLTHFESAIEITIVAGGETRFHSVQNGLKTITEDSVIFIHDGVRPLVSAELITRCYNQAVEKGSAIPVIPVTDSIRMVDDIGSTPVDRSRLTMVQTPQTFRSDIILPAFQQSYRPEFTDEATVVEAFGENVFLIPGERSNIKITTPEDMIVAEAFLNAHLSHA